MTTCSELFTGLECTIIGDASADVGGLAYRSDAVKPGDMFFCIVGLVVDGHSFAQDAIDRGAKFIVAERRLYQADTSQVTVIIVDDSRKAMAHVAARFYGSPSDGFELVGITGTNGKTTTTYLVEQIARAHGKRTGVIGTVGIEIANSKKQKVTLRELLERDDFHNTKAKIPLALGKDVYGKTIIADLAAEYPALAGTSFAYGANNQPEIEASMAAMTNISSLWRKVEAPMASGMVVPPPRFRLSERITRPGRESSRRETAMAEAMATAQISRKMRRSSCRLMPKKLIAGTPSRPNMNTAFISRFSTTAPELIHALRAG